MTEIEMIGNNVPSLNDENKIKIFVKELLTTLGSVDMIPDEKEIERFISKLRNKYKINVKKAQMRYIYEKYLLKDFPELNYVMSRYFIKNPRVRVQVFLYQLLLLNLINSVALKNAHIVPLKLICKEIQLNQNLICHLNQLCLERFNIILMLKGNCWTELGLI